MEVTTFLTTIIPFLTLLVIACQLRILIKTKKDTHEEVRRQRTFEIVLNWCESITFEMSIAEKVVEKLDKEQCKCLYNMTPFYMKIGQSSTLDTLLCAICPSCIMEDDSLKCKHEAICIRANEYDKVLKIEGEQLLNLRYNIIQYLNILESILVAWHQGIVNTEVFENEFAFLYNSEKEWNYLQLFREISGGNAAYPRVYEFCERLKAISISNSSNPPIKNGLI